MDKRAFLSELQRSLRILKEEELQDIISEYEQHIDMKVAKGLTEEEAIADFGSLEELKAEILAAYHVRADYEVEQPGKVVVGDIEEESGDKIVISRLAEEKCQEGAAKAAETSAAGVHGKAKTLVQSIRKGWKRSKELGVRGWKGTCRLAGWMWDKTKTAAGWCWNKLKKTAGWIVAVFPWVKPGRAEEQVKRTEAEKNVESIKGTESVENEEPFEKSMEEAMVENLTKAECGQEHSVMSDIKSDAVLCNDVVETDRTEKKKAKGFLSIPGRMLGGAVRGLCHMTLGIWNWTIAATWWCLKLCWNIWWIGWALFLGCVGLMLLFCLGVLAVLWAQGYPFAGITIGCLGLVLVLLAAAAYALTLLCRVRREIRTSKSLDAPGNPIHGSFEAEVPAQEFPAEMEVSQHA